MIVRCKFCGTKVGLIKTSGWYECKWSSPEGVFKVRNICPKCALKLDEKLQKMFNNLKGRDDVN